MKSQYWVNGELRSGLFKDDMSAEEVFDMIAGFVRRLSGYEIRYVVEEAKQGTGISIVFRYDSAVDDDVMSTSIEGTAQELRPFVEWINRVTTSLLINQGVALADVMWGVCDNIARRARTPWEKSIEELFRPSWEQVRGQMIRVLSGTTPFPM